MEMHDPPHPGQIIRHDCLEPLGLSVRAAAKGLGISRQLLSNVIAGRSRISADLALRLEQGLGSTARTWLAMQHAHDLAQLRQRPDAPRIARLTAKHSSNELA